MPVVNGREFQARPSFVREGLRDALSIYMMDSERLASLEPDVIIM